MEVDESLDLASTILILALFIPFLIFASTVFLDKNVGGFGVLIEKTALETSSTIVREEAEFKENNVMAMLQVADEYMQTPTTVIIHGEVFNFNQEFHANRIKYMQKAKTALNGTLKQQTLNLVYDDLSPTYWEVNDQ